jgi:hypothetical protein
MIAYKNSLLPYIKTVLLQRKLISEQFKFILSIVIEVVDT